MIPIFMDSQLSCTFNMRYGVSGCGFVFFYCAVFRPWYACWLKTFGKQINNVLLLDGMKHFLWFCTRNKYFLSWQLHIKITCKCWNCFKSILMRLSEISHYLIASSVIDNFPSKIGSHAEIVEISTESVSNGICHCSLYNIQWIVGLMYISHRRMSNRIIKWCVYLLHRCAYNNSRNTQFSPAQQCK